MVPISSMANFGGISTAPAVTAAYDPRLMPHAIVLAILSMVTELLKLSYLLGCCV